MRKMMAAALAVLAFSVDAAAQPAMAPAAASQPAGHAALVALFAEWRAFLLPPAGDYRVAYGPAAIEARTRALAGFRARLAAIDTAGWPIAARHDWQLVESELNGLDFELRVLRPWARDPSFYANVFADRSDVPRHEGPSAHSNLDLYDFSWPLSRVDQRRLTMAMAAIPANLADAKANLAGSTAHDLWEYGSASFRDQAETLAALAENRLVMVTLDGRKRADMAGATPELRAAIAAAHQATLDFAAYVAAEAPKHQGPAGVGVENYDWYTRNVARSPYDWAAQRVLLQRELDRSLASLRLEEVRNRALPPLADLDPAAFSALVTSRKAQFSRFMAAAGLLPDAPWATSALAAQAIDHVPAAKRNFFAHVNAGDPTPLLAHFTHWIDLERYRSAPHPDPIRATPPPFNSFADRSEGFATAFEEIALHAGAYDDIPRGRELVWIMLANRAARGLASLDVQANTMNLAEAGRFHAGWTPRGWSDPASPLVGFEQLLYARQPGYGASYITGKLMLDHLIAAAGHAEGPAFDMRALMTRVMAAGIVPVAFIEAEVVK